MKNKRYILLWMLISTLITIGACKKGDHTYINYQNNFGTFNGNAYEYFNAQPKGVYDSLLKALNRCPELVNVLQNDSITVFALTNKSFTLSLRNINLARKDSVPMLPDVNLATIDQTVLQTFLAKYFLKGYYPSKELLRASDGYRVPSVLYDYPMHIQFAASNASGFLGGGPRSILFSNTNESLFIANWVRVNTTTVDIVTKNAIINILPETHDFGFGADFIQTVNSVAPQL